MAWLLGTAFHWPAGRTMNDEQCIKLLDVGLLMEKIYVSKIRIDAPSPSPVTELVDGRNRASRR
jgi:hypothetical protein